MRGIRLSARIVRPWIGLCAAVLSLIGTPGFCAAGPISRQDTILPAADTLYLVGRARVDGGSFLGRTEALTAIAHDWRRSLEFTRLLPGYVVAASSAAYYELLEEFDPNLLESVRSATQDGSWVPVGGWWVESDLSLPHGESLIRQALYGQRFFERTFGHRAALAWSPGARSAAWTLPQILLGSGFDGFVTSAVPWNTPVDYPYNEFYWEGNDGSRIFTYRPFLFPAETDTAIVLRQFESFEAGPAGRSVALTDVGDPGSTRPLEALRSVVAAAVSASSPAMRFSRPEVAVGAVRMGIAENDVTVWRDDIYLERPDDQLVTQSGLEIRGRDAEVGLQTAEALAAIASGLGGATLYPRERLGKAWRWVLFNQSHDILFGAGIPEVVADAHARYDSAMAAIDSVVQNGFAAIRSQMDTRGETGAAYVLFNPLGHARVGPALIEIGNPAPEGETESFARSHSLALVTVPEIPALGAITVPIGMDGLPGAPASGLAPPAAGDTWMENAFLRVEIDPRSGAISRILDKANGRQALRPGGRANVLWVHELRRAPQDSSVGIRQVTRQEVSRLLSLSSAVTARAATMTILRQWGSSTIRQEYVLGRSAPFLEIRSEVEWREEHRQLTVAFEPVVMPDSATWEIPYGTIGRSGLLQAAMGGSDAGLPGQRWADVSDDGYGFSVLTDSGHGWEYLEGTLRLSLLQSPTAPASLPEHGRQAIRYAIYPHAGDWLEAGTHRLAAEYSVPLVAGIEPSHRGRLGRSFSFLSTNNPNAGIEWVKRAEDGDAFVLRIVEWGGEPTEAEVATGCPRVEARRANHLEAPGDRLPTDGASFRIRLRPHEIATVLLECQA
jgi:alpha-mannosidase